MRRSHGGRGGAFLHCARREDQHAVSTLSSKALLPREGDDVQLSPGHVHRENLGERGGGERGREMALLVESRAGKGYGWAEARVGSDRV